MTKEAAFSHWQAAAGPWAKWIKPSLFAQTTSVEPRQSTPIDTAWLPMAADTALILDLPGVESIQIGTALSLRGFCPVPLFNTSSGIGEVVNTYDLIACLIGSAPQLQVNPQGSPVFLLDSNRNALGNFFERYDFDNRWYVFASDFPTAARLRESGMRNLLVVTPSLNADLRDALIGHTELGPEVLCTKSMTKTPLPPARLGLVRGLSKIGRLFCQNADGSYGRPITHG